MLTSLGRIFLSLFNLCFHLVGDINQIGIGLFYDRNQYTFFPIGIDLYIFHCFIYLNIGNILQLYNTLTIVYYHQVF